MNISDVEQRRFLTYAGGVEDSEFVRLIDAIGWTASPLIAELAGRLLLTAEEVTKVEDDPEGRWADEIDCLRAEIEDLKAEVDDLQQEVEELQTENPRDHGVEPTPVDFKETGRGPRPVYLPFVLGYLTQHGPQPMQILVEAALKQWPDCKKQIVTAIRRANGKQLIFTKSRRVTIKK